MKKFKLPPDIQKDVDDTIKYVGGCIYFFIVMFIILVIIVNVADIVKLIFHALFG